MIYAKIGKNNTTVRVTTAPDSVGKESPEDSARAFGLSHHFPERFEGRVCWVGLVHPPCHVLGCGVFLIFMWCLERHFVCLFLGGGGWGERSGCLRLV